MDKIKCDKCGGEMEYRRNSSTQGWYCVNCDWSIVTSYIEPIKQDNRDYKIYLDKVENITTDQIKLVSEITGNNFLATRQLMNSVGEVMYEGKALEIQKLISKLDGCGLRYKVVPEFGY